MTLDHHHTQTRAGGYPFSGIFVPFTFVSFTLALVTDILFFQTANLMWQNFSAWLLFAGEVAGAIAILAGLVDLLRSSTRHARPSFAAAVLFVIVVALGFLNSLFHAGDGWTAVVPFGLITSAVTVVIILAAVSISVSRRTTLLVRTAS